MKNNCDSEIPWKGQISRGENVVEVVYHSIKDNTYNYIITEKRGFDKVLYFRYNYENGKFVKQTGNSTNPNELE